MMRMGSPGARRGARITSGGAGGGRLRRRGEGRSDRLDEPANPAGDALRCGRRFGGHRDRRVGLRSRLAAGAGAAGGGAATTGAAAGRRRGCRGRHDARHRRRGRRAPLGRAHEADPHPGRRRIGGLDDLGHARELLLVVDLQGDRGADRHRLAEHDERAGVVAIAHLGRSPDHHAPISNLCGAIHGRILHPARAVRASDLQGVVNFRERASRRRKLLAHRDGRRGPRS